MTSFFILCLFERDDDEPGLVLDIIPGPTSPSVLDCGESHLDCVELLSARTSFLAHGYAVGGAGARTSFALALASAVKIVKKLTVSVLFTIELFSF